MNFHKCEKNLAIIFPDCAGLSHGSHTGLDTHPSHGWGGGENLKNVSLPEVANRPPDGCCRARRILSRPFQASRPISYDHEALWVTDRPRDPRKSPVTHEKASTSVDPVASEQGVLEPYVSRPTLWDALKVAPAPCPVPQGTPGNPPHSDQLQRRVPREEGGFPAGQELRVDPEALVVQYPHRALLSAPGCLTRSCQQLRTERQTTS